MNKEKIPALESEPYLNVKVETFTKESKYKTTARVGGGVAFYISHEIRPSRDGQEITTTKVVGSEGSGSVRTYYYESEYPFLVVEYGDYPSSWREQYDAVFEGAK